jgi:hypothetical protein
MIPIEKITEQELQKRFNSLPDALKNALDSASNLNIANQICKNHHLVDEEKMLIVQQICGFVMFGFIHYYDIADEINGFLELNNPKLAQSIAKELEVKIFIQLKSELEKNYEPLPDITPAATQLVEITKKPEPTPITPAEPPRIIEEVKKPTSLAGLTAPKPTAPPSAPTPAPPAPPPVKSPSTQLGASRVEPPVVSRVEPVFIHKEAEFKPITPKPGFHLEIPIPKPPAAPKPAVLEPAKIEVGPSLSGKLPGAAQPIKPPIGRTEVSIPRVIHYSQWKTSLEKPSGKPEPVPLSQLSAISIPKPPPATHRVEPPAVSPSTQLRASRVESSLTPRVEPMPPIGGTPLSPQQQKPPAPASYPGLAEIKPLIPVTPPSRPTEPYKPVNLSFPPVVSPSTQLGASRVEPPMPKPPTPPTANP